MAKVFVGDEGTEIILDCGVDISSATVRKIIGTSSKGPKIDWPAVAEGSNSIKHVIVTGELDTPATLHIQAYIEMPGWKGRGSFEDLIVLE